MAKPISLEIITPEKLVLKGEVDSIVLPAVQGQIGILSGHAPLLAQLKEGFLKMSQKDQTTLFAVSGGFAEVQSNEIKIFAETAEMGKEIDVERARLAAEEAKKSISKAATPQDLANAQAALRRALLRLRVSEKMSRRMPH